MNDEQHIRVFHIINIVVTISMLVISIVSVFFIGKDIITYHVDVTGFVFLLRMMISMFFIIFSVVFLLMGIVFPSDPNTISKKKRRKIKKAANIGIILSWLTVLLELFSKKGRLHTAINSGLVDTAILSNAKQLKVIRGIWSWWKALILFLVTFFMTWVLLGMSYSVLPDESDDNFFSPFIDNGMAGTYNTLIMVNLLLTIIFIIVSMLWRIAMDRVYRYDPHWRKEPVLYGVFAFIYIALMVAVTMYFRLSYLSIVILILGTLFIIGYFEEKMHRLSEEASKQNFIIDNKENDDQVHFPE